MELLKVRIENTIEKRLVDCEIQRINTRTALSLVLAQGAFEFDWKTEQVFETYALVEKKSNKTLGLISLEAVPHELRIEVRLLESSKENIGRKKKYDGVAGTLIAFACREAFRRGFYGFVSLIPKTELIEHYMQTYGFVQAGRHLATDLNNSKLLIDKYLNIKL